MKDKARSGMDYWNDLVRIGNQDTEEYQALIAAAPQVEAAQKRVDRLEESIKQVGHDIKNLYVQNRSRKHTPEVKHKTEHRHILQQQKEEAYSRLKAAKQQAKTEKKATLAAHRAEWKEKMKTMRKAKYLVQGNRERICDNFLTALRENRKKGAMLKPKYWPLYNVHFTEWYPGGLTLQKAEEDGGRFVLGDWIPDKPKRRRCTLRIRPGAPTSFL